MIHKTVKSIDNCSDSDQSYFFKKFTMINGTYFIVNTTNTGNCQMASIAWVNMIHDNCRTTEELETLFKEIVALHVGKLLCLIDVTQDLADIMIPFLKNDIVVNTPYKSTNDSNMVIIVFRTKNIREDYLKKQNEKKSNELFVL